MSKFIEIRWHGRGGQGAKTAALLLADVAFNTGRYIQGFPEYGPERMGAPITAYNRISDFPIRVHSNINEPDYVVVIDETLLQSVEVTRGLKADGALIINTTKTTETIRKELKGYEGKIYKIDARSVSERHIGRNMPNTPMLGCLVKVLNIIPESQFLEDMKVLFDKKFTNKPGVAQMNMNALLESMTEVSEI